MPKPFPTPYFWLSAEDVVRHALASYYAACRNYDAWRATNPEDADADMATDPGGSNALFAEDVSRLYSDRLYDQGYELGVPGFHGDVRERIAIDPEYWGLTREYVDNSPRNSAEKPAQPDIHCRFFETFCSPSAIPPLPSPRSPMSDFVTT